MNILIKMILSVCTRLYKRYSDHDVTHAVSIALCMKWRNFAVNIGIVLYSYNGVESVGVY